jgi:glycosyltransferase
MNNVSNIIDAINSIKSQTYSNIEYILIDGCSTDGTTEIIASNLFDSCVFICEKDNGLYYALNKGFQLSTGEVIGILHSDDFFASDSIIEDVMNIFKDESIDCVYGDLIYVSPANNKKIIRKWVSGIFTYSNLRRGWMPPHPTVFLRKSVINKYGIYNTEYTISADYDFIIRCFRNNDFISKYLPKILVVMRNGGKSNKSLLNILIKIQEDYSIIKRNKLGISTLIYKNISKLRQFVV